MSDDEKAAGADPRRCKGCGGDVQFCTSFRCAGIPMREPAQTADDLFEPGSARLRLAIASLIDIVEEMAFAMEAGTKPEKEWVTMLSEVLAEHRRELGIRRD